jgi:hypothetical protein
MSVDEDSIPASHISTLLAEADRVLLVPHVCVQDRALVDRPPVLCSIVL